MAMPKPKITVEGSAAVPLLTGAVIERVLTDSPGPEPGILIVRATTGTRYRLCSTELGWWLEMED